MIGFLKEDCLRALKECGGRLDEAALWLTQNAQPLSANSLPECSVETYNKGVINVQGFEVANFLNRFLNNSLFMIALY